MSLNIFNFVLIFEQIRRPYWSAVFYLGANIRGKDFDPSPDIFRFYDFAQLIRGDSSRMADVVNMRGPRKIL